MTTAASSSPPIASQQRAARVGRAVAGAPIVAYQKLISPALPRRCKYEPTCSRYALEAIRSYGIFKGIVLAAWRLLRCNPWSDGGYDPVEAQRVFSAAHATPEHTAIPQQQSESSEQ
jgi:uncharacterized protein